MSSPAPPRLAHRLLERVLPERYRDALIGDLAEEYALRARSAEPSAVALWYWGQACRSVPRALWSAFTGRRWLPTLGIGMAVYIAAGVVEFAATAAVSSLLAPDSSAFTVLSAVIGLATMALGGYLAGWIRPGAAAALAVIVMIAVAILMVTMSGAGVPLWYQLAFLFLGPVASLAGGALAHRRRVGRAGRAV